VYAGRTMTVHVRMCSQGFDQEVARSRPNKKTRKYEGINLYSAVVMMMMMTMMLMM